MAEKPGFTFSDIRRVFGLQNPRPDAQPSQPPQPDLDIAGSVFATLEEGERQIFVLDFHRMTKNPLETQVIVEGSLRYFGVELDAVAEKMYAMHYIYVVSTLAYLDSRLREEQLLEVDRRNLVGVKGKISAQWLHVESEISGEANSHLPKQMRDAIHLSREDMVRVRQKAESDCRVKRTHSF